MTSATALRCRLVAEGALSEANDDAIKQLLDAAFRQYTDIFAQVSYWGARPEYRLWLEDDDGAIVAHLDFGQRVILVGGQEVRVVGVGEVATHPDWQGRGVGRRLMAELHAILTTTMPVPFAF